MGKTMKKSSIAIFLNSTQNHLFLIFSPCIKIEFKKAFDTITFFLKVSLSVYLR